MKTEFICESCGYVASKWYGRCPQCSEWNSFTERDSVPSASQKTKKARSDNSAITDKPKATRIKDVSFNEKERTSTGIGEFDRVLGGGIVAGSVVLLSDMQSTWLLR